MSDNAQQLNKLLKVINYEKILSKEDVDEVIAALVSVLANNKKSIETLNADTVKKVDMLYDRIIQDQVNLEEKIKEQLGTTQTDLLGQVVKETATALQQVKDMLDEVRTLMPKDGKSPEPSEIVPLVLEQIKLPEQKEIILDDGERIVEKINDLATDNDDLKIDVSHIKGLEKFEKEITNLKQRPISGGMIGRDFFKDIDLSDSLDGVTKTFNIQAVWNIISVSLSSYPYGSLRKNVDYTFTPTTITFTSEIDAETQLASGQKCILTVVL